MRDAETITINIVWTNYQEMRDLVINRQTRILRGLDLHSEVAEPAFLGWTLQDVTEHFDALMRELDDQASLFLMAAAEATLRRDFWSRVDKKLKDEVAREFRRIAKEYAMRGSRGIRLAEDVLDIWAEKIPSAKSSVSAFKGALNFRHWLAHGRYWNPKLGQNYDPASLTAIIAGLFQKIGADY